MAEETLLLSYWTA